MADLHVEQTDSHLTVRFANPHIRDESQIAELGAELTRLCQQAGTTQKTLRLDCQGVEHMSSAMIGKLVLLNKAAKSQNVALELTRLEPRVLEAFTVTRVHKMFTIVDP